MPLRRILLVVVFATFGCEGPRGADGTLGPAGPAGPAGADGSAGPPGTNGTPGGNGDGGVPTCPGLAPGASSGLNATVNLSAPANGTFFVAGERPVVTIHWTNDCGQTLQASDLGTASLYVSGPRLGALTKTAAKLLNCVVDRAAADRQHHFINLAKPSYADPSQKNLTVAADGTITYTLAPISDEAAGTYTVGVWSKSKDDVDQVFPTIDLQ
ncbi:MAG: hypothetical protein ACXVZQ_11795, partial [Terriglobales bacterium]